MAAPGAGVSTALRFIAAARADRTLTARLAELDPEAGLDPVVAIAHDAGYRISADDLRAAHAHDWGFRRARYLLATPAASAATTTAVVNSPASSR
jgi:hypothetical protein